MSPLTPNIAPEITPAVHVAVGVIADERGRILLARRSAHQHQGGLWEFPGGKIELGETPQDALARELCEEVGIQVQRCEPLIQIPHHYPDKSVVLHVWRITKFAAQPEGKEGQPLRWVEPDHLPSYAFPTANHPIVRAVRLPDRLAVTGPCDSVRDFEQRLQRVLERGVRLIYFRMAVDQPESQVYFDIARSLCTHANAQLMARPQWHGQVSDDQLGLHLSSVELSEDPSHSESRRSAPWVSASCHSPGQLQAASDRGVDFVLLGPVQPTATHPDCDVLGWTQFGDWVREAKVPVYALGGLVENDLSRAKSRGAQGIAALSAFWS